MTDTTNRLPDLVVRTTSCGDRFGWRLVTLDDERFLTSMEQAEKDGSQPDYATRVEARIAAGQVLLAMVRDQSGASVEGEIVSVSLQEAQGEGRLAA